MAKKTATAALILLLILAIPSVASDRISSAQIMGIAPLMQLSSTLAYSQIPALQQEINVLKKGEYEALWVTLNETDLYLRSLLKEPEDLALSHGILLQDCQHPIVLVSKADYLGLHANELAGRKGLTLRGGYANKSFAEDNEGDSSYLELDWDLLKGGYRENKRKALSVKSQAKVARLNEQIKQLTDDGRCRRYQMSNSFVGSKAALLTTKMKLMEQVNAIERRAYFKGWSYLDDAFKAESDLRLISAELDYLHSNEAFDQHITTPINPPIIDLDMAMIADAIRNDSLFYKVATLQKEQIRREQQAKHPNRFQLFARKNMNDSLGDTGDGLSVGFRFSVPLEKRRSMALEKYDLLKAEENLVLSTWERLARARAAYAELFEQKERAISQQYRFLTAKERMRRTFIKQRLDGNVDVALGVIQMRSYIQSAIELVKAKEELYRRVNEVFLAARLKYMPGLIYRSAVSNNNYRSRLGKRSIYLWSPLFNALANDQLLDVVEAKGIQHLILSVGKKTQLEKAKRLIKQAKSRAVDISIMVGANEWIYTKNNQRAALTVAAAAELTGSIHLDIEPHTLPGYKENRDKYLASYIEMLKYIKPVIESHHLSVAVPTHWPASIYEQVAANSDHVYIMSYETDDVEKQVKRLTRVLNGLKSVDSTVVLNIKDFQDEWALENMIEALNSKLHIDTFALHKMADFLIQPRGQ